MNFKLVEGTMYGYTTESDDNGLLELVVYDTATEEKLVGLYFDHDSETAVVEGSDFQEEAPYFLLRYWQPYYLVEWALEQIPGNEFLGITTKLRIKMMLENE